MLFPAGHINPARFHPDDAATVRRMGDPVWRPHDGQQGAIAKRHRLRQSVEVGDNPVDFLFNKRQPRRHGNPQWQIENDAPFRVNPEAYTRRAR